MCFPLDSTKDVIRIRGIRDRLIKCSMAFRRLFRPSSFFPSICIRRRWPLARSSKIKYRIPSFITSNYREGETLMGLVGCSRENAVVNVVFIIFFLFSFLSGRIVIFFLFTYSGFFSLFLFKENSSDAIYEV